VTLVEWAERLADAMPAERLDVIIDGAGDDPRRIAIRAAHRSYARYVEAVPLELVRAAATAEASR
jgi:tRNA A37 threonylcarbamoyladenosine biosynthesis protein TsaE